MNKEKPVSIQPVMNKRDLKQFVQFYYDLYRDNPYAVPYLYSDEMATLSPQKNTSFECCECQCFLAYEEEKIVGRIAAIINHRANARWKRKLVRFGWFDFIDDERVSRALLQSAEDWGKKRGMTEIAGPLGFTDMDREGMLIQGFDRLATLYVNYNYPYYQRHIERIPGMVKDNDYVEYRVKVPEVTPEKFAKTAELIEQRYHLHVHKFTRKELVQGGKAREIFQIVNETYKDLYGYSRLSDRQVDQLVRDYIKKADLNLVTGVTDGNQNDRLIGFGVTFPSFSKAMQQTRDGRLWPFGWWHLLRCLIGHHTDTVDLLLIGVLKEYRTKGANALIFNDLIAQFRKYGFKWAEAMPQMETNKGVLSQWQYLDAEQHRLHRCYKKRLE